MAGKYAVMCNEGFPVAWLFEIEGNAKHRKLDRREGKPRDFNYELFDVDDDSNGETAKYRHAGVDIAIGRVVLPVFGGCQSRRKKRKLA